MNVPKQPENPFLKLMRRYRDDPVCFAREVIGIEPDEWQVELLDAVAAPAIRRISVRSGHGVGKSTGVAMAAIWHVLMRYPSKTVVTAPTSAQLFDACFAEMKSVAKRLKPPFKERAREHVYFVSDVSSGAAGGFGRRPQRACVIVGRRGIRRAGGRV